MIKAMEFPVRISLAAICVCTSFSSAVAEDVTHAELFRDAFKTDTRSDYQLSGKSSWQDGVLTLQPGAILQRNLGAGPSLAIDLSVLNQPDRTDADQETLWVWLKPETTTACFVRINIGPKGTLIAVVDTEPRNGQLRNLIIRNRQVAETLAQFKINYHFGLVTISSAKKHLLTAHIGNGPAEIRSVGIQAHRTIGVTSFNAQGSRRTPLTTSQSQRLTKAEVDSRKAVQLYNNRQYASAVKLAERVLGQYEEVVDDTHSRWAQPAYNLAVLLAATGESARAEKLHRKVLNVRARTFGQKHPACAESQSSIARFHKDRGQFAQATQLHQRALKIKKRTLGTAHPSVATTLNDLALVMVLAGDYVAAEPRYMEAKKIWKETYGTSHPHYATCINNLGALYASMGNHARAEEYHREALGLRRRIKPRSAADVLSSQRNLANALFQQSKTPEATEVLKKAVAVSNRYAPKTDQHAGLINDLAIIYESTGALDDAEKLSREALELRKRNFGPTSPQFAASANTLALIKQSQGEYDDAERLYRVALQIRERELGRLHADTAFVLNNLATLFAETSRTADAIALHREVIKIRKQVLGTQHADYATSLTNLAHAESATGNYREALRLYESALERRRAVLGKKHSDYALGLNNLGAAYTKTGDYVRAAELHIEAREILRASCGIDHPDYAKNLNNLAVTFAAVREFDKAADLEAECLRIIQKRFGPAHPQTVAAVNNAALSKVRAGQTTDAIQALESLCRSFGDQQVAARGLALHNLAYAYSKAGKLDEAADSYRDALAIRLTALGDSHPDHIATQKDLATVMYCLGETEVARTSLIGPCETCHTQLFAAAAAQASRQQHQARLEKRHYLDWLIAASLSAGDHRDAIEAIWQWKGAVTRQQQHYREMTRTPALRTDYQQLQQVARKLSSVGKRIAEDVRSVQVDLLNDLNKLTKQREQIERQIAAKAPVLQRLTRRLPISEVVQALPEQAAFVDFLEYEHPTWSAADRKLTYERRYVAAIVSRTVAPRLVPLGTADAINTSIEAFRQNIRQSSTAKAKVAGQQLSDAIWKPIRKHLPEISMVVISPDGLLSTTPFVALPGQKSEFLIEDHGVVRIPSVWNLLADSNPSQAGSDDLLIVGDVDYGEQRRSAAGEGKANGSHFESLPGFTAELQTVQSLHKRAFENPTSLTLLSREEATVDKFLREAPSHSVLHIITHGYFADPDRKSFRQFSVQAGNARVGQLAAALTPDTLSGLALSGANEQSARGSRTGLLLSSDLATTHLANTSLVVLSACETGLGAVAGGEGLAGLQRAFHIAGARTVVASQWKVDDIATQELMRQFYTNLWVKKQTKAQALRNAQLAMLRHPAKLEELGIDDARTRGVPGTTPKADKNATRRNTQTTLPYFWAAFQLSGDWR